MRVTKETFNQICKDTFLLDGQVTITKEDDVLVIDDIVIDRHRQNEIIRWVNKLENK